MQAAIFDVDGTLLDSMGIWDDLAERYLRSLGVQPEPGLSQVVFAMTISEAANYLIAHYQLSQTPTQVLAQINEIVADFYRREAPLKPGAEAFLHALAAAGVPIALVSSGTAALIEAALRRLHVWGLVSRTYAATDLGISKREPTLYLRAAADLGAAPAESWVFEDALYAITVASTAGFPTVGLFDKSSLADQEAIAAAADLYWREFPPHVPPPLLAARGDEAQ